MEWVFRRANNDIAYGEVPEEYFNNDQVRDFTLYFSGMSLDLFTPGTAEGYSDWRSLPHPLISNREEGVKVTFGIQRKVFPTRNYSFRWDLTVDARATSGSVYISYNTYPSLSLLEGPPTEEQRIYTLNGYTPIYLGNLGTWRVRDFCYEPCGTLSEETS